MTLAPGTRLGPYEITAQIGEGGMGLVFRAKDFQLGREVALKVLPEGFTADPERVARFEREAKLLASLNHPNIAQIYGLETAQDGTRALVMELVEGPTLAERLAQGGLAIDESLSLARQIAEALEEAHEKGIIHRDLKPQNIKASIEGKVKVLDFGLAKAMDPSGSASPVPPAAGDVARSPTLMNSPTLTGAHGTQLGVILGTAAYMAPEQARGGSVDKRADIWAFGVVLYEMLTGSRLFAADTVPDTLARVLTREPDLAALPAQVPPAIRRLLRRCLERRPRHRLHDIADARIVIEEVLSGRVEEAPVAAASQRAPGRSNWRTALPWLVAAGVSALWLATSAHSPDQKARPARRALEFSLPLGTLLPDEAAQVVVSPDGGLVVFNAVDPATGSRLWLRRLDQFDAQPLHGTEGASYPFWSPDAKSIGFFHDADGSLRRYDLATGTAAVMTSGSGVFSGPNVLNGGRGASWAPDGTILLSSSSNGPLQRIGADGRLVDVTSLDPKVLDGSHRFPVLLPDGEHFLFTFWSNQAEAARDVGGIYLGSFAKGLEHRLTPDLSQAALVGGDRIVVRRDGALVALPFDPKTFAITGEGEKIAEKPLYSSGSGALAASGTAAGDVVYALASGTTGAELDWFDRRGARIGTFGGGRLRVQVLALSPDGRSFAAQAVSSSGQNIWVGDGRREVIDRLTPDAVDAYSPVWSPDGRRIAFSTEAEGTQSVYVQDADGSRTAELLVSEPDREFLAADWSADGRTLLLQSIPKRAALSEIWVYDLGTHAARALLSDPAASLTEPTLSADGRWLAYTSDESGNPEIFVRPYPSLDRKWKVSQGGALHPHWRHDGGELLYLVLADRGVMAVDVASGPGGLEIGIPRRLFPPGVQLMGFAPNADHSRFLAGVVPSDVRTEPIRVLLGWRGARGIGRP